MGFTDRSLSFRTPRSSSRWRIGSVNDATCLGSQPPDRALTSLDAIKIVCAWVIGYRSVIDSVRNKLVALVCCLVEPFLTKNADCASIGTVPLFSIPVWTSTEREKLRELMQGRL